MSDTRSGSAKANGPGPSAPTVAARRLRLRRGQRPSGWPMPRENRKRPTLRSAWRQRGAQRSLDGIGEEHDAVARDQQIEGLERSAVPTRRLRRKSGWRCPRRVRAATMSSDGDRSAPVNGDIRPGASECEAGRTCAAADVERRPAADPARPPNRCVKPACKAAERPVGAPPFRSPGSSDLPGPITRLGHKSPLLRSKITLPDLPVPGGGRRAEGEEAPATSSRSALRVRHMTG